MPEKYDAILVLSFGGPEGPDDVMPFLENVLRGRNVPRERMLEVAKHYQQFGGISPINEQNRQLIAALQTELETHGPHLPIYWGNRNWHPMLSDTMQKMVNDGVKRAICFVTSAFSSYSGCRQYREDIEKAQAKVGPSAPHFDKIRVFFNHPGFIEPMIEKVEAAMQQVGGDDLESIPIAFTAHSLPSAMSNGCRYTLQLEEACRIIAERLNLKNWNLVFQSRSGPPTQPWLEPDICDHIQACHENDGIDRLVIVPVGFISDHMEVIFDLDHEASELCSELGIKMARAETVGIHPRFITAIRELIIERMTDTPVRMALGTMGPSHDICPEDCCPSGRPVRPAARPTN